MKPNLRKGAAGAVAVAALVASVQTTGVWAVGMSALSGAAVAVLLVVG